MSRRSTAAGSSPLSRGIPTQVAGRLLIARIIPALAGNTASGAAGAPGMPDHPRSRGEYARSTVRGRSTSGSSPLSRGILRSRAFAQSRCGIIPALAGNTFLTHSKPSVTFGSSPLSRGIPDTAAAVRRGGGSSPLSRGILLRDPVPRRTRRIIPALAGNTSSTANAPASTPDHPRSRGEYAGREAFDTADFGSSPLSRGIRSGVAYDLAGCGIIPALAGNTCGRRWWGCRRRDHPRSRGEYFLQCSYGFPEAGSSPLSRGILGTVEGGH